MKKSGQNLPEGVRPEVTRRHRKHKKKKLKQLETGSGSAVAVDPTLPPGRRRIQGMGRDPSRQDSYATLQGSM